MGNSSTVYQGFGKDFELLGSIVCKAEKRPNAQYTFRDKYVQSTCLNLGHNDLFILASLCLVLGRETQPFIPLDRLVPCDSTSEVARNSNLIIPNEQDITQHGRQ